MKDESIRHCVRCYERLTDDENSQGYQAREELNSLLKDRERLEWLISHNNNAGVIMDRDDIDACMEAEDEN